MKFTKRQETAIKSITRCGRSREQAISKLMTIGAESFLKERAAFEQRCKTYLAAREGAMPALHKAGA